MSGIFEYRLTVAESEIDDLDHAGNYHYVKWMQRAAIAHSTELGWSAQDYIDLGAGWVVRSHEVTYLKPAFEGDAIVIRTWVASIGKVTSLRRYEIYSDGGELLAEAQTDWAFINYRRQRPTRIPPEVLCCFKSVESLGE